MMTTRKRTPAAVFQARGFLGAAMALLLTTFGRAEEPSHGPLAPAEAARRMILPEGFSATVFASEPDVVQPIAMTIDPRGRLWVVENTSYPMWRDGKGGKDRILIFEDSNGDGRFDRRTVFWAKGTNYTGIEVGFGGVWVCATPNLLFIPDHDGDDHPDGPPEAKLNGWSENAQHNLFNGLKWGPDGWLWGLNGILSNSRVGKPGTPDDQRIPINCGVWRYHPTRGVFEAVAHGTTNPWGLDFDLMGEAFITNCVIAHLFRVIPGSRFERMFGNDLDQYAYQLMTSCADHLHWAGGRWTDSREGKGEHGRLGGGHAHVGAMIYLGDNWPERYRGGLFTCNIHGRRVNHDRFERDAATGELVAKHAPDFLQAVDPWFRGLELRYGPDGGVYLTDWSDQGECHENDADGAHRENGRIYKIVHGSIYHESVNLAALDDGALVKLQEHRNEWHARTARRLLQERAAGGKDLTTAHRDLRALVTSQRETPIRLRAIWALHATGGLDEEARLALLDDAAPEVQAWGVRLMVDDGAPSPNAVKRLVQFASAKSGGRAPAPLARLYLASALERVPLETRWPLAEALARESGSIASTNHILLMWYGLEPLVALDGTRASALITPRASLLLCRLIARRLVAAGEERGLSRILPVVGSSATDEVRLSVLEGVLEGLAGRKRVKTPVEWPVVFDELSRGASAGVRARAAALGLVLGDPRAEAALRAVASDRTAAAESRLYALQNLVDRRATGLAPALIALLDDATVRAAALRGLAAYKEPNAAGAILARYSQLTPLERDDAVATLASRPDWARQLLEAIDKGRIARRDVSTTVARQILAFGDAELTKTLGRVWGALRATARDKSSLIGKYKQILAATGVPPADLERGRALFARTCGSCHRLHGQGGDVGPDITGSDRANADYILENVLDPSASVGRDYLFTTVATTDGRLIAGIVKEQTPAAIVIQTASERITLPREDVEAVKTTDVSMMPEGQLDALSAAEIRDLFAYLASSRVGGASEKGSEARPNR